MSGDLYVVHSALLITNLLVATRASSRALAAVTLTEQVAEEPLADSVDGACPEFIEATNGGGLISLKVFRSC
jgi:hypothetical protein